MLTSAKWIAAGDGKTEYSGAVSVIDEIIVCRYAVCLHSVKKQLFVAE